MHFSKAIKKVENYLSVKANFHSKHRCVFHYGDNVGSFLINSDGNTDCFHIRRRDDYSDIQSDYFAGHFFNNLSQLLKAMKPAPAKFNEGTLIRIKKNKRATRWGLGGRTGLVITSAAGGSYSILWNDTNVIENYCYERDMEEY